MYLLPRGKGLNERHFCEFQLSEINKVGTDLVSISCDALFIQASLYKF